MAIFSSRKFRPSTTTSSSPLSERIGAAYRAHLGKHPFLLFGLPFMAVIVGSSFLLTPATALRYERHDRRTQQMSQDEAMELGVGSGGKKNTRARTVGSDKEEYYRLMAKDLDNWEQKRVQRFKGEPDGRL